MGIPRLSPKEALILELLMTNGEMYGLEMVNAAPRDLKRGTVYVTLSRMADKGFVDSRQVKRENEPGIAKRMFRVTGMGQRVLRAWRLANSAWAQGAEELSLGVGAPSWN